MDENGHIYVGERCVFCNVNVYDNSLYNDDAPCPVVAGVDREPVAYTTETGGVDSPLPQWLD